MAVEAKRGCGYRKVGGTYMMSGFLSQECDRLPFELDVCPCCGEGYRPSRALRKINPDKMLGGEHSPCPECGEDGCFICHPGLLSDKAGHYLEWIGGAYYRDPLDFVAEAKELGISRRLKNGIPMDLVVGETAIFLAHRNVLIEKTVFSKQSKRSRYLLQETTAIFGAFIVTHLEHICTITEKMGVDIWFQLTDEERERDGKPGGRINQLINLIERGVKLIPVPDNDPDHQ